MASLFHTFLVVPLYNLLIILVGIIPGGDIGIAVILLTLIVKLIIMPLSLSALTTQRRMRLVEPELKKIRETLKEDKEEQAKQTFALYKKYGIKPFSSIITLFIQLPILFALYNIFRQATLVHVDLTLLYSFVHAPAVISPLFLGFFVVASHSIILTVIAAIMQFVQARYTIPLPEKSTSKNPTMAEELGRSMALQSRFMLPLIIGAVSYFGSCAIALYFITSSVVALLQEVVVRRAKHPFPTS